LTVKQLGLVPWVKLSSARVKVDSKEQWGRSSGRGLGAHWGRSLGREYF